MYFILSRAFSRNCGEVRWKTIETFERQRGAPEKPQAYFGFMFERFSKGSGQCRPTASSFDEGTQAGRSVCCLRSKTCWKWNEPIFWSVRLPAIGWLCNYVHQISKFEIMITFYFFTVLQQSCSSNHGIHCLDVGYEGTSCAKPQKGGKTGRKAIKLKGWVCARGGGWQNNGWSVWLRWIKSSQKDACMTCHIHNVCHIYPYLFLSCFAIICIFVTVYNYYSYSHSFIVMKL